MNEQATAAYAQGYSDYVNGIGYRYGLYNRQGVQSFYRDGYDAAQATR